MSRLDEDRLRRLIEAGRSVVAERELEQVLDRLLAVARELTGARYAALGVLDERRDGLADFLTLGIDEARQRGIGDLPRGRGVLGLLISNPEPLRLADVGEHHQSYGFPAGHPEMRTFLGVPILLRGEAWGNLYLTEKQGGQFDDADEEAAVVLAAWAAIAIENARLYRRSERRRSELERTVRVLEAAAEIAGAVGGETRLDRVLELIAKRSRAVVEASALVIALVDDQELVIAATAGTAPRDLVGVRLSLTRSLAGRVVCTGEPVRLAEVSKADRAAMSELEYEPSAGVLVPMQFRGATVGVIGAFDRVGGPDFRAEDERLLVAAAAAAATAVATAQSVEQDRVRRSMKAAEDERRRWARELHDETLQALGGLRVLLSSASQREEPAALRAAIGQAVDQLGRDIANLRTLIAELRPAALDELGLEPALDTLIARMSATHGLQIAANVELRNGAGHPYLRLDPELETVIYRLVQEALTNVGRHAQASRVAVDVSRHGDEVRVDVIDDGRGFNPSDPTTGFGLIGMRERVELTHGRLEIASSAAGTRLHILLPALRLRQPA